MILSLLIGILVGLVGLTWQVHSLRRELAGLRTWLTAFYRVRGAAETVRPHPLRGPAR
jgi:hypothetical protein